MREIQTPLKLDEVTRVGESRINERQADVAGEKPICRPSCILCGLLVLSCDTQRITLGTKQPFDQDNHVSYLRYTPNHEVSKSERSNLHHYNLDLSWDMIQFPMDSLLSNALPLALTTRIGIGSCINSGACLELSLIPGLDLSRGLCPMLKVHGQG